MFSTFQERINFEFEKMFETGVDEMSWDDTVGCIYIFSFICFVSVCHLSHMTKDISIYTQNYAKQHRQGAFQPRKGHEVLHHITSQARNPHSQWEHHRHGRNNNNREHFKK